VFCAALLKCSLATSVPLLLPLQQRVCAGLQDGTRAASAKIVSGRSPGTGYDRGVHSRCSAFVDTVVPVITSTTGRAHTSRRVRTAGRAGYHWHNRYNAAMECSMAEGAYLWVFLVQCFNRSCKSILGIANDPNRMHLVAMRALAGTPHRAAPLRRAGVRAEQHPPGERAAYCSCTLLWSTDGRHYVRRRIRSKGRMLAFRCGDVTYPATNVPSIASRTIRPDSRCTAPCVYLRHSSGTLTPALGAGVPSSERSRGTQS
jgi:hypothetical protein